LTRMTRRMLIGAFALCAMLGATAPSASAVPYTTTFLGCPNTPAVFSCFRSDTRAGHIKIGATDTPINKTQTLIGGLSQSPDGPTFTNLETTAAGGFTGDALEVPGGLAGLTGLSEFFLNLITFGANGVYAKPQLVGTPRLNLATLQIRAPIKVNLLNPFLRSGCGIGSPSSPITLNLTPGTTAPPPPNTPISGHPYTVFDTTTDPNVLGLLNNKLVDNAFGAPGASGCDLIGFGLLNGLVNARAGLPSAAGRNEAIFDQTDVRLIDKLLVFP
jgi:hypothetical protein